MPPAPVPPLPPTPPTRRSFLKTGLGAAVAAATAPQFLHAQDKTVSSTSRPLVVGKDNHTYEVIDNWGKAKLPNTYTFGNTHAIAETADGRILVHHQHGSPDATAVFDPDGNFISSWGKDYTGGAHGMQLRKEGNEEFLYLAVTSQHFIAKTTLDGKELWRREYPKEAKAADGKPCYADEKKYVPTNIAFHPTDGSFYVADGYGSWFVHRYDKDANYLNTFGGPGSGEGQLHEPHGIYTDTRDPANPLLAVCDRRNVRLHYFTLDGKFSHVVAHDLRLPCHIDQRNTDLLIPDLQGRVTIFDKNNELITHLGDNENPAFRGNNNVPQDKLIPGQFCSPHGAIWDRAGNIYVGEWLKYGRVTKLRHVA